MVDLQTIELDMNQPLLELDRPIATPYLEDYLFKIFKDLEDINDALIPSIISDGTETNSITTWDNDLDLWTELSQFHVSWDAGVATIEVEDDSGVLQLGILIDGDGGVAQYFQGLLSTLTLSVGMAIFDTNGQAPILQYRSDANVILAETQSNGTDFFIQNLVPGQEIRLQALAINGIDNHELLRADPDSGVQGFYNDLLNWIGQAQGFDIHRTTGTSTFLDFMSEVAAFEYRMLSQAAGPMVFQNRLTTRGFRFENTTDGDVMLEAIPTGALTGYFAGDDVARTAAADAGSWEFKTEQTFINDAADTYNEALAIKSLVPYVVEDTTGGQEVTTSAQTLILDNEVVNPSANYALAADAVTVSQASIYYVKAQVYVDYNAASATGQRGGLRIAITVNGTQVGHLTASTYWRELSGDIASQVAGFIDLAANDVVTVEFLSDSPTADHETTANRSNLHILRVGVDY